MIKSNISLGRKWNGNSSYWGGGGRVSFSWKTDSSLMCYQPTRICQQRSLKTRRSSKVTLHSSYWAVRENCVSPLALPWPAMCTWESHLTTAYFHSCLDCEAMALVCHKDFKKAIRGGHVNSSNISWNLFSQIRNSQKTACSKLPWA